jgi:hypothetical protein
MDDGDYQKTLAELDNEFPGMRIDDSIIEYLEERERWNELKSLLMKRGIYLLAGIILLITAVKTFPASLIIIFLFIAGIK